MYHLAYYMRISHVSLSVSREPVSAAYCLCIKLIRGRLIRNTRKQIRSTPEMDKIRIGLDEYDADTQLIHDH